MRKVQNFGVRISSTYTHFFPIMHCRFSANLVATPRCSNRVHHSNWNMAANIRILAYIHIRVIIVYKKNIYKNI